VCPNRAETLRAKHTSFSQTDGAGFSKRDDVGLPITDVGQHLARMLADGRRITIVLQSLTVDRNG
jgi:hypothetical protein